MSIPRVVHHVWLGGDPPESKFDEADGWKINVIREDEVRRTWGIDPGGVPTYVSNLVRFLAVRDFGGIYADMDIAPLDDFSDMLDLSFFAFKIPTLRMVNPTLTSNQLFGSEKNGRLVRAWCDEIQGVPQPKSRLRITEANGAVAFSNFIDHQELLSDEVVLPGGLARKGPSVRYRAVELSGSNRLHRT